MTHAGSQLLAARVAGNATRPDPVAAALQNGAESPSTFVAIAVGVGFGALVLGFIMGACVMKWRHRRLVAVAAPTKRFSTAADLAPTHLSGRRSMYAADVVQPPVLSAGLGGGLGQTVHAVPEHVYLPSSRVV